MSGWPENLPTLCVHSMLDTQTRIILFLNFYVRGHGKRDAWCKLSNEEVRQAIME
jgi:hypothetical protein